MEANECDHSPRASGRARRAGRVKPGHLGQAVREAGGQVELPSPAVVTEASELVEGDSCI